MDQDRFRSEDERQLHSMGYAQELSRRMGGFQNFAISFSIICILSGGLASFGIGIGTTGPWMATIGWIIGGVFALIVAASLGQIASAYPTAGGLYHWSSILGGKFWGWLTAYTNLLGLLFVIPAVNVILYGFIRDLFVSGILGWDTSNWTNFFDPAHTSFTHGFVVVAIITAAQCLLNHFGIKLTTILTDISGYLIFVISVIFTVLLFMNVKSFNLSSAFTFVNTTATAGVAPEYGAFIAILMGMLYPLFTITGFDASAHTSEETVDARRAVPRGMVQSVFWSLVFGFLLALGMVLALPAVYDALVADPKQTLLSADAMKALAAISGGPTPADLSVLGSNAFTAIMTYLILPSFLGKVCAIGIVLANFFCALSAVTSTSRMVYAFARDRGLPGVLSTVSAAHRTPVAAIWFTGIVTLILVVLTAPLNAFNALSTGCAMYLYMSYAMPVLAGMIAEGKTWTTRGPFDLGGLYKVFGVIVLIGLVGLIIGGHAFVPSVAAVAADAAANPPVVASSFAPGLWYYTVGFYLILIVVWFAFEKNRFQGPPIGEEIAKRQAI
ncbi:MAG: amino acid permease, partial [Pseudomonadota bacterium]|nr:amino acid permease [Pseudomonadota bacterium]